MSDEHQEEEVSMEGIDSALTNLLKTCEATDLAKAYGGVSIDSGGHVDERGQTGGGYAGSGDMGGLDSMMIGKMQEALVDAGFPADAIAAFMSKKDDEEEDPRDNSQGAVNDTKKSETAQQGRQSSAEDEADLQAVIDHFTKSEGNEPSPIANAVDVSPFMEDFVQKSAELFADLKKSLHAEQTAEQGKVAHMAAALYGIGKMVKSQAEVIDALNNRLQLVERQPNPAKGARTLTGAKALHKSLPREAGAGAGGGAAPAGGAPGGGQLTKSQVVSALTYMNLEKGMSEIGGVATSELAGMLEAGNQLHPVAAEAVHRFLTTHPHEARTAVSYR